TDGQFIQDVITLAFEEWVRFHREDHIQVAGCTSTSANLTLAGDTHINTIVYAGRDIDHHAAVVANASLAPALFTGRSNHAALAMATLTHRHVDELSKDRLLHATNLA